MRAPALLLFAGLMLGASGLQKASRAGQPESSELPPAAHRKVDFRSDVVPILLSRCARCHTESAARGGFRMDTRETFLSGGDSGKVVIAGHSDQSYLVELVAGMEPERVMPAQGPRLTAAQIGLLRAWIDQGLAWEEGFSFAAGRRSELAPRRPGIPGDSSAGPKSNPIDRILSSYFTEHAVDQSQLADDQTYARRVWLDLVGLLPPPDELTAFSEDRDATKRERLVDRLLADRANYAIHWLTFWNDALRNAYRGTGYIDGGRKQITGWLYASLYDNKPLDRFVHELIDPVAGSEGFVKGIEWRGVVNASQRPELQAAQNLSQVFLGTNLKCASCHDSFVNQWRLTDAYALASVFADKPLEIHRCDVPTGKFAEPGFIWRELGSIDPALPKPERMKRLADIITSPANGRLARTMVNRLWAIFFGRGIIEPLDDMDQAPFDRELLDWLAADFQDRGWDLKHTIRVIVTSRAYQMPSVGAPGPDQAAAVFRGPLVRRVSAEQFVDGVSSLTGAWQTMAPQLKGVAMAAIGDPGHLRAALANDDPLTRALGRPNREQVVTRRDSVATTLELLELTNGGTLDRMLGQGAEHWLARKFKDSDTLLDQIYLCALARKPSPEERAVLHESLGPAPTSQSVRDVLWIVSMHPDFQLIR